MVGASVRANFEKRDAGTMFPGNGCRVRGSMIGVESLEKSPVRRTGSGTAARNGRPLVVLSPSYEPNAKMRSRCSGPPDVPPN
jgi:hypothetical protein